LGLFGLLIMIPLNFFLLRVNPPVAAEQGSVTATAATAASNLTTRAIVTSRAFWIPLLVLIPISAAFSSVQFNLGTYLKDLSYPTEFTGQMIALTAFMMILGKLLYGKLADNVDHRYLFLFMALLQIIALTMLMINPSKLLIISAAMLLGVSGGGLIPMTAVVFAARFDPSTFGRVMGLLAFFMLIQSFGSIFTGWMYDTFGNYDYAFATLIALTLPGIFVVKWLPPPMEKATQ